MHVKGEERKLEKLKNEKMQKSLKNGHKCRRNSSYSQGRGRELF